MSALYWTLWAVFTVLNGTLLFFTVRWARKSQALLEEAREICKTHTNGK